MSAQRLVLAVAILVGIGTLVALPDLLHGRAGEEIRVVEVSEPIGKDRVSVKGDEGGSRSRDRQAQEDQSDHRPASSAGGFGGRHTDDTGPDASVSAPRSASLGSSASAAASEGGDGAGTGGSSEVGNDQPAPVSPLPGQPPSTSSSDDDVDVNDDDVEVEEPEDEAGD
jgi:hypothetical protein